MLERKKEVISLYELEKRFENDIYWHEYGKCNYIIKTTYINCGKSKVEERVVDFQEARDFVICEFVGNYLKKCHTIFKKYARTGYYCFESADIEVDTGKEDSSYHIEITIKNQSKCAIKNICTTEII